MKRALVLLVVLLLPGLAAAESVALDYQAADPSCIDAARFADQVSAKLGFMPWDPAAPRRLRVRIAVEGAGFTGTLTNVDGSAKVFDGATCNEVTAYLAISVAAVLDRRVDAPPPAPAPAPAVAPGLAMAAAPAIDGIPVSFVSPGGRRVEVTRLLGQEQRFTVHGRIVLTQFDGVCTSPCTAGMARGRHTLRFRDPDAKAFTDEDFVFDAPTTVTVTHRSRRNTRIGLIVGGLALAVAGTAVMASGGEEPGASTVVGLSTLGVGGAMFGFGWFIHDTFDVAQAPSR